MFDSENEFDFENVAFVGELSLDGNVHSITGILPMCIEAKKLGIKEIVVPKENAKEPRQESTSAQQAKQQSE